MTQAAHEFIQRARGLIGRRQYQEAVKVCRLGLLSHPTLVEGRIVLASALLELGRHDEVLAEMRVALDLAADSPQAHILKGEAFLRKGDLKQAEEALLAARKLDPKNDRIAQLIAEVRRGGLRPPVGAHGRVVSSGGADDFAVGGVATRVYPATGKLLQDPVEDYDNAAATMVGTEPPTGFVDVDPALLEATRVGDDAEATRVGDDAEATVQVSPELAADLLLESEVGLDSLDLGTPSIGTAKVTESARAAANRRAHDDPTRAIGTAAPARPARARTPEPEPDDMDPEIDPPEADDLESGGIELDPDDSAVQMLDGGDLSSRSKLPLKPRNEKETQKARPGGREAAASASGKQAPPRLGRGAAFADGSDETRPETAQAKAQPKLVKLSSPAKGAPGQHIRDLLEDDSDAGQELESTTPQGIDVRKQARPGAAGGGVRREVPPSAIAAERSVAEAEARAEAAERAAAERAAAERAAAERAAAERAVADKAARAAAAAKAARAPEAAPTRPSKAIRVPAEAAADAAAQAFMEAANPEPRRAAAAAAAPAQIRVQPAIDTGLQRATAALDAGESSAGSEADDVDVDLDAPEPPRKPAPVKATAGAVPARPAPGKPVPARAPDKAALDKAAVEARSPRPAAEPTGRTRGEAEPAKKPAPGGRRRLVRRRGAWAWWQILVVVGAVAMAGVVAGLVVRSARMKKQLSRLRDAARSQLARGNLSDYNAAEENWSKVISMKSDRSSRSARARVRAAMAAEFGEGLTEAQKQVTALGSAENMEAASARIYLALAQGKSTEAVAQARAAATKYPNDTLPRYLLGRSLLAAGDAEAAVSLLELAVQKDSGDVLAWRALGVARAQRGQLEPARDAFQHALALNPGHVQSVIDSARLDVRRGDKDSLARAESDLESVVNARRDQASRVQLAWAHLALAELRARLGEGKRAREALSDAAASRPEADAAFGEALATTLLALGDESAARAEAEKVLALDPGRLVSRRILAQILLADDRPQAALEGLGGRGGAAGQLAADPEAMVLRGRAYLMLGELELAQKELDAALVKAPADVSAKVARARVDVARGQPTLATAALRPLMLERPGDPELAAGLGAALRADGSAEAVAEARKVLEAVTSQATGPGAVAALLELARLHRSQGRLGDARGVLSRALELKPRSRDAKLEDALIRFDSGEASAAAQSLAQLTSEGDARPLELLWAARTSMAVGQLSEAEKQLDRLAKTDAYRGEGARERGRLALARRNPPSAVSELRRAVQLAPDDIEARVLLVDALLAANDSPGADAALRDARTRPALRGAPELEVASAHVHLWAGRFQPAIKAASSGMRGLEARRAPSRVIADAHVWLGRAFYDDGQLSKAAPEFQRAGQLDASNASAFYYLGLVFDELGQSPEEAKQSFQKAIAADPSFAEAHFQLGDLLRRMGQGRAAKASFEKYLELAPRGDYAEEARRLVDSLR